ncbi:hypothetical protein BDL97_11G101500 [Sphagnum fallax]|jgi:pimeloyl-ACP methyl ester carboxylesterase|nr:hypothetical protein BDL97_11G101500 [Sphagnum fallax]KAH8948579.1 hypothetical protein BDL97_11G101500 [Sphagnum fallax]KAH8948580.1 hypothetical protein BDL97_11G101500 [Sphagnum fallax]KAH8948581.1 hypothetical protein BDL97_11G101500 [Sphagnum fallax]
MASLACSSSISGTHLLPTALAPAYSLRSCKISFRRSVESGSRRSGLFDVSNNTGHWILQRVRQYATVQAAATAKNDTTATTGRTAPIPPPSRVNVSPHGLSPPIVHRPGQIKGEGEGKRTILASDEMIFKAKEGGKLQTVMIVHGILGAARNWRMFSKRVANYMLEETPCQYGWRMVMVDLRNHGNSATLPGLKAPHDIPATARDLANFIEAEGKAPDVLIAHALGGKVALDFVQNVTAGTYGSAALLPKQLWVLESPPGPMTSEKAEGDMERVLQAVQPLKEPLPTRKWLSDKIVELGFNAGLAHWLGTQLKRINPDAEEMEWVFNIKECYEMLQSNRRLDYWSVLENPLPQGLHIAFVRAGRSERMTPDEGIERLEAAASKHPDNLSFHTLPNAGHWLHTENISGFIRIVNPYLSKLQ